MQCVICMIDLLSINDPSSLPDQSEQSTGTEIANLACSHLFHLSCLLLWAEVANSCPTCRREFDQVNISETIEGPIIRKIHVEKKKQAVCQNIDDYGAPVDDLDLVVYCESCGQQGDLGEELICCDDCDDTYHLYCVGLDFVPDGSWYCPKCRDEYSCSIENPDDVEHSDGTNAEDENAHLQRSTRRRPTRHTNSARRRRVSRRAESSRSSSIFARIQREVINESRRNFLAGNMQQRRLGARRSAESTLSSASTWNPYDMRHSHLPSSQRNTRSVAGATSSNTNSGDTDNALWAQFERARRIAEKASTTTSASAIPTPTRPTAQTYPHPSNFQRDRSRNSVIPGGSTVRRKGVAAGSSNPHKRIKSDLGNDFILCSSAQSPMSLENERRTRYESQPAFTIPPTTTVAPRALTKPNNSLEINLPAICNTTGKTRNSSQLASPAPSVTISSVPDVSTSDNNIDEREHPHNCPQNYPVSRTTTPSRSHCATADNIKRRVADLVASHLMPYYRNSRITRDQYKSINRQLSHFFRSKLPGAFLDSNLGGATQVSPQERNSMVASFVKREVEKLTKSSG
ncbi:uncharacterized protein VTP21DRAFT_5926 [Calcarisporiella thermophila]|uniref:uncharacterized protein n=1 Tax=Calcarisporiella thermophila TaxID=911321 RepID=UPI0037425497